MRITRTIRAAAATIVEDEPMVAEQLRKMRLSGKKSVAQVLADLDAHVALLDVYTARMRPLFPADFDEDLARIRGELAEHGTRREDARSAREASRRELQAVEAQLQSLVQTVRAVFAVTQRAATARVIVTT
jgi:hypothetical protein